MNVATVTTARREARNLYRADYDPGDPWGWVMGHRFAIAELMFLEWLEIPEAWEFRPSPSLRRGAGAVPVDLDVYPDCEWRHAWACGYVDEDALRWAGDVLARYASAVVRAGRSY